MPELPEVEVVRRGLAAHVTGRVIATAEIRGHRVARRHVPGPDDLASRLGGRTLTGAHRRGKYLWLSLADGVADPDEALIVHLGMSGQMLVAGSSAPEPKHTHARLTFTDAGDELRFVDQRTFGGFALADLVGGVPSSLAHIALDPFDPDYDRGATIADITRRRSGIKRVLLNQTVVSGIGNIYADEALWRAGIHGERLANALTRPAVGRLLDHAKDVMAQALEEGGTSFDELYVNVNGASGYFARSLAVYRNQGNPCERCGATVVRERFMNRYSHFCPVCQRKR